MADEGEDAARVKRRREEEDDNEEEEQIIIQLMHHSSKMMLEATEDDDTFDGPAIDHRLLPRTARKQFRPAEAVHCINRDYLGPVPLFDGREFDEMFRISKSRFQRLMEDVGNANIPFYTNITNILGSKGASMVARLLLPLKSIAYGVPSHCFRDYFQMSKSFARQCCLEFDSTIKNIYEKEYLRCPTAEDVVAITNLHKAVHGIFGLLGALDCMHCDWKNCPMAWQGSFKGKEGEPTIVLEAMADYHCFFWHAFFGSAGTLNDKSILLLSPLLDAMVSGKMEELEQSVVPYKISSEEFDKTFMLVDGIYPDYSRFVKGLKVPVTRREKKFSQWQEACRKDIERAFGILQGKFQCMARPFHQLDLEKLTNRVACCLILHNMCVSDRVMDGDVHARYKPDFSIELLCHTKGITYPPELRKIQSKTADGETKKASNGIRNGNREVVNNLTRLDRWTNLDDRNEHVRLTTALMSVTELMRNPRVDKVQI